jgi:dipeptidase E
MKKMIVASTSTLFGQSYLEYLLPELKSFWSGARNLLFIPYARPGGISHDAYTDLVREALSDLPLEVNGIHEFDNPGEAVARSEALFIGGGNTFVLLDRIYKEDLMSPLREAVLSGIPYLGTSAGSNVTGPSVKTTNDMPIVHPPGLEALGLIPFNLNPHYLDPVPGSRHQGETRETRIKEFHEYNSETVAGLREGSWIEVRGDELILKGEHSARIFKKGNEPVEIPSGSDLSDIV